MADIQNDDEIHFDTSELHEFIEEVAIESPKPRLKSAVGKSNGPLNINNRHSIKKAAPPVRRIFLPNPATTSKAAQKASGHRPDLRHQLRTVVRSKSLVHFQNISNQRRGNYYRREPARREQAIQPPPPQRELVSLQQPKSVTPIAIKPVASASGEPTPSPVTLSIALHQTPAASDTQTNIGIQSALSHICDLWRHVASLPTQPQQQHQFPHQHQQPRVRCVNKRYKPGKKERAQFRAKRQN